MSNTIRYVIVVHGIGEKRKNQTVIEVVNRFAEARRQNSEPDNRNVLTLGRATGQTGKDILPNNGAQWMEFDGIPQDHRKDVKIPWRCTTLRRIRTLQGEICQKVS